GHPPRGRELAEPGRTGGRARRAPAQARSRAEGPTPPPARRASYGDGSPGRRGAEASEERSSQLVAVDTPANLDPGAEVRKRHRLRSPTDNDTSARRVAIPDPIWASVAPPPPRAGGLRRGGE